MEIDDQAAQNALLRLEFAFFLRFAYRELGGEGPYQHNWHVDAIGHQLDRIRYHDNRRLIVTIPPRHLKSVTISTAWVAWMLGHNPALKFLCISYGQELADDHARGCLKIMQSAWYRAAFPSLVLTRRSVSDFLTSAGGGRMSTSVDGVTTGFGADIIIIDDPMKAQDANSRHAREKIENWMDQTLMQRLNDQEKGAFILVMQRLHEADLAGTLIERGTWYELRLPAIAEEDEAVPIGQGRFYQRREGCALHPARQSLEILNERKLSNAHVFAAQYQQRPVPAQGNIFEAEWLKQYDPATLDQSRGEVVQSWDTASKDNPFNDWSVCVTARLQGQSIYIIDVFRKRMRFPELERTAIDLARTHRAATLLIEDAASGTQLLDTLRAGAPARVPAPIPRKPEGDKISRALGVSSMVQSGRLFLPRQAHWLGEFTSELLGFPATRHDDQVDALTQLLVWVRQKDMYREPPLCGPILMIADDYGETRWSDDDSRMPYGAVNDPWMP